MPPPSLSPRGEKLRPDSSRESFVSLTGTAQKCAAQLRTGSHHAKHGKNVAAYVEDVPAERKAALAKLRELCCTLLKGFEESMMYGGPCYSRNGEVEVGFASQKHFIGLVMTFTLCPT